MQSTCDTPPPTPTARRQAIASEVRAALGRDGRTASQLATDAGLSKATLSRKLRGLAPISVDELIEIAYRLNVEPVSLIPTSALAAA